MNKAKIYGALKIAFRLAGFPLFLLMMLITLMPMFNVEVMGDYARNWALIFFAIWVAVEIIGFVMRKFVSAKSENHHKLTLVVMAAVSILAVLLPTTICDAVQKKQYNADRAALTNSAAVKSYDSVAGWHRDFTKKYRSDVYALINSNYDFMQTYGLTHTYSEWYDNANKEANLGYKYGSFEKAAVLLEQKLQAVELLAAAKAELVTVEAAYAAAAAAYEADPSNENKAAFEAAEADLVRLKGIRIDITPYKEGLVDVVMDLYNNVLNDYTELFPDGIGFEIFGLNLGDLEGYLGLVFGILKGDPEKDTPPLVTKEMLMNLIPDVIFTGAGPETISTYEAMINGGSGDLSLAAVEQFDFSINHYPAALAAGAVKYAAFMCVGLILLSIFMTDFFAKKQKEAKGGNDND